jgi:hypothetical protein
MIGTVGTMKQAQTMIHQVPLLLCPVCFRVEVHHRVRQEYEILAEFALDDGAAELNFSEFVPLQKQHELFSNCVNTDFEDPLTAVLTQIDMALDLISLANQIEDEQWKRQLFQRLRALSKRKEKLIAKRRTSSQG